MLQNQITRCCIWARWFKFSQFVQKTLWNQWGTCCLCQAKSWHCQILGQGHAHRICLIWVLSTISRQPKILLAHLTTQVCHICSCLAILYDFRQWHLTLNQWQYVTSIFLGLAVELGEAHRSTSWPLTSHRPSQNEPLLSQYVIVFGAFPQKCVSLCPLKLSTVRYSVGVWSGVVQQNRYK